MPLFALSVLLQLLLYPFGSVATATHVSSLVDFSCNIIAHHGTVELQHSLTLFVAHCNCNNVHFCDLLQSQHCLFMAHYNTNTSSFYAHCNCNLSLLYPIAIVTLLLLAMHCNNISSEVHCYSNLFGCVASRNTHYFLHCYGCWKQCIPPQKSPGSFKESTASHLQEMAIFVGGHRVLFLLMDSCSELQLQ